MLDHGQKILDKYQHPYLGECTYMKQTISTDSRGIRHKIYIKHDKPELGGNTFVCDVITFCKDFIPYKIELPDIEVKDG